MLSLYTCRYSSHATAPQHEFSTAIIPTMGRPQVNTLEFLYVTFEAMGPGDD